MKWQSFLTLIIILVHTLHAKAEKLTPKERLNLSSAHREATASYKDIVRTRRAWLATHKKDKPATDPDAAAVSIDALDFSKVPSWDSTAKLTNNFNHLRDSRFLIEGEREDFKRRLPWLYPDDGCYARADIMNYQIKSWDEPIPRKMFIFGDLEVKTPHSPSGSVTWWYHVAPLIMVDGKPFILDPAIEPYQALPLKEWALKQIKDLALAKFAICESFSYSPFSDCEQSDDTREDYDDIDSFLRAEWTRQAALGHDPETILGDHPPWQQ